MLIFLHFILLIFFTFSFTLPSFVDLWCCVSVSVSVLVFRIVLVFFLCLFLAFLHLICFVIIDWISLINLIINLIPGHCEHPLRFCKKVVIVLRTWVHHRIVARQYGTMCSREGGTHNVWCTRSIGVRRRIGVTSSLAVRWTHFRWFGGVPFVNN